MIISKEIYNSYDKITQDKFMTYQKLIADKPTFILLNIESGEVVLFGEDGNLK